MKPTLATEPWIDAVGRMMSLQIEFFAVGVELLGLTLRSVPGLVVPSSIAGPRASARHLQPPPSKPFAPTPVPSERALRGEAEPFDRDDSNPNSQGAPVGVAANKPKETDMAEKNLSDDMLKLVQYCIVCIERGHEKVLVCNECKLFSDNMTDCDFDGWVLADYTQHNKVPCDKKFLRVTYEVVGRWPKQDLNYQEKQLQRLSGIQRAILECCDKGELAKTD